MTPRYPERSLYLVILVFLITPDLAARSILTDMLDLTCTPATGARLDCGYRLLQHGPISDIHASLPGANLSIVENESYPWSDGLTAILFLVDTSDPARQNVIDRNIEQIAVFLRAARPHHRMGLASFDKDLQVEAPVGTPLTDIGTMAKSLRAVGKTTELYRNVIRAIAMMAGIEADRKAIFLFSDGQAEDKAYFHQDVIKAAREAGVIINGLGYPRSVSLSVALQTLRRLSEETGGLYVEADNRFDLPDAFLESPFDNIDSGGRFAIDLATLPARRSGANPRIELTFASDSGDIRIPVPLPVSVETGLPPAPVAALTPAPPQTPAIKVITPPPEPQNVDLWVWYGIPILLAILTVLVVITIIVIVQQKGIKGLLKASSPTEFRPFAYLVVQDEKRTRYPITSTTWRIGRTRDNELTLQDSSVSRRHAEIQRYSNGKFIIFDVDSLNGVYVNEEKIKKKRLQEGDIIEIGDIYLRFTLYASDFQLDEDTIAQHTKAPAVGA
ncbi:MAG: FHA domain-containing protein [Gammaproteobacteria bacterium]